MNAGKRRYPTGKMAGRAYRPLLASIGGFVLCCSFLAGCGGNLPRLSDEATITVWRSLAGHGLRTSAQLVAGDLREDREIFLRFYRNTIEVGECDPVALERELGARGLLIVRFADPAGPARELHVFQTARGEPLTVGHGPIDVDRREPACPEYRYRASDVAALQEWLTKQPVPTPPRPAPGDRPRAGP